MKVLMLGWELPPYNSGGLGIACYQLCKALSRKNIDIEFILPYEAEHNIEFMNIRAAFNQDSKNLFLPGSVYESASYSKKNGLKGLTNINDQQKLYEEAVAKLVEEKEYDVVHAHDWLTFRAGLRLKSLRNWPLILHIHSVESDRAGSNHGNSVVKEIELMALSMADRIIAVSEHTKKSIMRDYDIPDSKIEVIYNSINLDDIEPLEADNAYRYLSLMKSLGYKVVVNVGRLTIQKGLPNLLQSAQKVIGKFPKTLFLMVGSGEQYNSLINLSAELGISQNVLFAEFQRGKNWRDAFGIADLFVMPSVSEPFGLTPLEAISYGSPTLVSKQSGISEVLSNCLKVDFWDINEMANIIASSLDSDPLRHELWSNAYKELDRLTWEETSNKVIELYENQVTGAPA